VRIGSVYAAQEHSPEMFFSNSVPPAAQGSSTESVAVTTGNPAESARSRGWRCLGLPGAIYGVGAPRHTLR
jgi:hypothetical protein